jgi:hypothetical protein
MTTTAFIRRTPQIAHALAAIHGKHPRELVAPVRGSIDCPRCRSTLTYTITPARRITGNCAASGCLRFDQ